MGWHSTRPTTSWAPASWRTRPAAQQPEWPDEDALKQAQAQLAGLPPLVFAGEARHLTRALGEAAKGRAFLLQAGDCAESFAEFNADAIRDKLKIILQMAVVLTYGAGVPVVKVGRIAGQFAKPRSSPTERVGDQVLDSFRGHMVNDDARADGPDARPRAGWWPPTSSRPPPSTCSGPSPRAGSPTSPRSTCGTSSSWPRPPRASATRTSPKIDRALRFMAACGIDLAAEDTLHQVDFWTSHEALILDYEEALTRRDSLTGDWYDCSAHMLWVGDRTRQLDGAHCEFLSGIHNPSAPRSGRRPPPTRSSACASGSTRDRVPGRLTLITRLGVDHVEAGLPPLLRAVRDEGHPVVWVCDPMHGNTFTAEGGRKTRRFDDILGELRGFFLAHREVGTWPGGVHVELTGDDVTECLGGVEEIVEDQLHQRYTTTCDPRLNARQSLDLAFRVAELLRA